MRVVSFSGISIVALLAAGTLNAAEYYVTTSGNDTNPGTAGSPWKSIGKANRTLVPGDTVYLGNGEYRESISPVTSGRAGQYINYRAWPGQRPVIVAGDRERTAIMLVGRSYIRVDGIGADGKAPYTRAGLDRWVRIQNGGHNIIENAVFRFAKGWAGVLLDGNSKNNRILKNDMKDVGVFAENKGNVIQIEVGADRNLIEGNRVRRGGHDLLSVRSSFNIIRNNDFDNSWSESDGPGSGYRSVELKSSSTEGFNVFEGNRVTGAGKNGDLNDNEDPAAMKVDGTNQIIRRNLIINNGQEAAKGVARSKIPYVRRAKVYHNVFYKNGGPAWIIWMMNGGKAVDRNAFVNNIVYQNRHSPSTAAMDAELHVNLATNGELLGRSRIFGNAMAGPGNDSPVVNVKGIGRKPVTWFEDQYPGNFGGNTSTVPEFVADRPKQSEDFKLKDGSQLIDGGVALTRTMDSGNGRRVRVEDAGYFTDGFGLVNGDSVVIGGRDPVRVEMVDYESNVIVLEQAITWSVGEDVSLPYSGRGPDIGIHEQGAAGTTPVSIPGGLMLSRSGS